MIFQVYYNMSDLCGNTSKYHVGYIDSKTESSAKKAMEDAGAYFGPGFGYYSIEKVNIDLPKDIVKLVRDRNDRGSLRGWP